MGFSGGSRFRLMCGLVVPVDVFRDGPEFSSAPFLFEDSVGDQPTEIGFHRKENARCSTRRYAFSLNAKAIMRRSSG